MTQIHAEASLIIESRPEDIYAVLADYHVGHPAILPENYFTKLIVEQGGRGAGTIVRVHMDVLGVKTELRMVVSEPEPRRVLVEQDEDAGVTTTFTIDPLNEGRHASVMIATDAEASPGFRGMVESLFNPIMMRHIFRQQLQLLAEYVQEIPAS